MLIRWKRSLALALGLLASQAWADDPGWGQPGPANPSLPAVTLGRPILAEPAPATTLGKPIPLAADASAAQAGIVDRQLHRTGYSNPNGAWVTVRARGEDAEDVQPAVNPPPAKPGLVNPYYTWAPAAQADEPAPPPRVDGQANPSTPPRAYNFFPPAQPVPSFGGGLPPPLPGGPPPGPVVDGALSLGSSGTYPGNELYIRAEGLLWWTKGAPVPPLGTTFGGVAPTATSGIPGASGTTVLLGDDHYVNGTRGGVRIMAGYWFDDAHLLGIEGGFFVLGRLTTTQSFSSTGPTNLAVPFTNAVTGAQQVLPIAGINFVPIPGGGGVLVGPDAGSLQLRYTSSFWGYEANLRGICCQGPCGFIDGLVGFRGLGLDENLTLTTTSSATVLGGGFGTTERITSDSFAVQNRFYGGQIGTIMEARRGLWVFDLTAKLALGATQETVNIAGSTVDLRTGAGNMAYPNTGFFAQGTNIGRHEQSSFAVVPEVGLTIGYQITPRLRTFVGYNFIYWSRVARPGDQINRTVNIGQLPTVGVAGVPGPGTPPAPTFSFHQTDFWAQGITFGLEYRW